MSSSKKSTALGVTSTQSGHTGGKELNHSVSDFVCSCQGQSMSEIEKMRRYIELTELDLDSFYEINICEVLALARIAAETPVESMALAFEYGRAKGYQAAKRGW